MFTTNLLPAIQKQKLFYEETRRILQFFLVLVILVSLWGMLFLFPSLTALWLEREELERVQHLEEEALVKLAVEKKLNNFQILTGQLTSLKDFLATTPRGSDTLETLFNYAGGGVRLDTITIKGRELTLWGSADSRPALLEFEKKLREEGRFQDIISPLSNIIRETDITFTIRGTLKPSYGL